MDDKDLYDLIVNLVKQQDFDSVLSSNNISSENNILINSKKYSDEEKYELILKMIKEDNIKIYIIESLFLSINNPILQANLIKYNQLHKIIDFHHLYIHLSFEAKKVLLDDCEYVDKLTVEEVSLLLNYSFKSEEVELLINNSKVLEKMSCTITYKALQKLYRSKLHIYLTKKEIINKLYINDLIEILKNLDYYNRITCIFNTDVLKKLSSSDIASLVFEKFPSYQISEILLKLIDIKNIPYEKMIFIINNFNISEDNKKIILSKLYPQLKLDLKISISDICEQIKNNCINTFVNMEDNNSLEILKADLIKIPEFLDIFDEVTKKLFENVDKKITKNYFEIWLRLLINKISKSRNLNLQTSSICLNPNTLAVYIINLNRIIINCDYIEDNLFSNIRYIETIFHEFVHLKQFNDIKSVDNYDYNSLKFVKDYILSSKNINYQYGENYIHLTFEVDARCKAFIETYKFIFSKNEELAKNYLKDNLERYVSDVYSKNGLELRKKQDGSVAHLNKLFDENVDCEEMKKYILDYPILALEYNIDGTKKTDDEIEKIFNDLYQLKVSNQLVDEISKKKYIFYYRLLNKKYMLNAKKIDIYKIKDEENIKRQAKK